MDFRYITDQDWTEWCRKFPQAYTALLHCALRQEYICLSSELNHINPAVPDLGRAAWVRSRLADLRLCGVTSDKPPDFPAADVAENKTP